jgi:phosphotransferase system enzyme I (PtsI)
MKMDKNVLRGFVTEKGGATSHTVILAKSLGIPAIVGVSGALDAIADGDTLLLDAFLGTVTIDPDDSSSSDFNVLYDSYEKQMRQNAEAASMPAITKDGFHVDVNVNTGDTEGIKSLDWSKCDGVGLLRTEFLYMASDDYPDEETQFTVYSELAGNANGKEVIIRTLDIGGDKQAGYMDLPVENNPFLGYRAIRICLDRRDVFHTQLRAILRASAFGNVKIMFPMIVSSEELRDAKKCVEDAKVSLRKENKDFREDIPVGIMVETPAAVLISEHLARDADFFSIGSNDLIQYTTATDRMNEQVQNLYESCNPAVLRAICIVAHNANEAEIPWGICGEVGSDTRLIPLWVTLGVSELSVAPSTVGRVKALIRKVDRKKLRPEMERILDLQYIDDIKQEFDAIAESVNSN